MEISVREAVDVKVVVFDGKLDTQTSPGALDHLTEMIGSGELKIVVNLENLDYISSAGLRVLLAAAKQLKPDGGEIRICHLNEVVREVFDISGFVTIFKVFGTESEALDGF